jgi:hypothetical protein
MMRHAATSTVRRSLTGFPEIVATEQSRKASEMVPGDAVNPVGAPADRVAI